jgi:hypothetical protein
VIGLGWCGPLKIWCENSISALVCRNRPWRTVSHQRIKFNTPVSSPTNWDPRMEDPFPHKFIRVCGCGPYSKCSLWCTGLTSHSTGITAVLQSFETNLSPAVKERRVREHYFLSQMWRRELKLDNDIRGPGWTARDSCEGSSRLAVSICFLKQMKEKSIEDCFSRWIDMSNFNGIA